MIQPVADSGNHNILWSIFASGTVDSDHLLPYSILDQRQPWHELVPQQTEVPGGAFNQADAVSRDLGRSRMSLPMLSAILAEDALIESRARCA